MAAYKSTLVWQIHPFLTETSADSEWKYSGCCQSKWGKAWSIIKLNIALNVSCLVTSSCTLETPCSTNGHVEFSVVTACTQVTLCNWWDPYWICEFVRLKCCPFTTQVSFLQSGKHITRQGNCLEQGVMNSALWKLWRGIGAGAVQWANLTFGRNVAVFTSQFLTNTMWHL